jgi:hypothetical protein
MKTDDQAVFIETLTGLLAVEIVQDVYDALGVYPKDYGVTRTCNTQVKDRLRSMVYTVLREIPLTRSSEK